MLKASAGVYAATGLVIHAAPVSLFLHFLCVLKGYSTRREGIRVLKVKHLRL